jgi:hypothetical protein
VCCYSVRDVIIHIRETDILSASQKYVVAAISARLGAVVEADIPLLTTAYQRIRDYHVPNTMQKGIIFKF